MVGALRRVARSEFAGQNLVLAALVILGLLLCWVVVVTPLDLVSQSLFALLTITAMLLIKGHASRGVTLILVTLSIVISTRYIWWRLTETLQFASPFEAFLGIGLILAELYAWLVLVLGYIQTAWPLNRTPVGMPEDVALWPTVDLLIPTYNEPLVGRREHGVRRAVGRLSARQIAHLHSRRRHGARSSANSPRRWASGTSPATTTSTPRPATSTTRCGLTDGEFLALFDSDHVPNRAFLQLTVGWFLVDPKLALVQTPHHFYSPDPFERNLQGGDTIPNEGLLFYGLIQDGNDLWNAAFFCGSCAVMRRSAVELIGGFATQTVTEDAHTALRLHRAAAGIRPI